MPGSAPSLLPAPRSKARQTPGLDARFSAALGAAEPASSLVNLSNFTGRVLPYYRSQFKESSGLRFLSDSFVELGRGNSAAWWTGATRQDASPHGKLEVKGRLFSLQEEKKTGNNP